MIHPLRRWAAAGLVLAAPAFAQPVPSTMDRRPDAPPTPAAEKAPEPKAPFADVPPVQPLPRLGYFPIPPTGPGYYTALDAFHDVYREKPPKYPYPRHGVMPNSFFDIDWRYLDDPKNDERDFFDCLKRQKFGDCSMFTTGGEFRYRYNHEPNSRLFNGTPADARGRTNDYNLSRVRVYGDLWVNENVRVFVEYIDAQAYGNDLVSQPTDRNWGDLLNAFVDLRTVSIDDHPVWVRIGRQELLYGSERLISPLDWVNTRRTFQGIKAFWQGEKLSVDAFLVNPVIPNNREFDWVDQDQVFSGLWATYRPDKTQGIDAYALNLDRASNTQTGQNRINGGGNVTTLGSRYHGARPDGWLWDFEGMVQFGSYVNQGLFAQAATAAGGYHFKDAPGTPTVWVSYDFASGDPSPGTGGVRRTFDQLFPFGHYYFGFIDVVGRRNINDLSLSATAYPTEWVTATAQFHDFTLAQKRDALYNAGGTAIRQDPTGRAGRDVGREIDFLVNFHLTNHQDILVSYSYLFAGDFIRETAASPAGRRDPQALYVQYTYRW